MSRDTFYDGNLQFDENRHKCWADGHIVELTQTEWIILSTLLDRPGELVQYKAIARRIHGNGALDSDIKQVSWQLHNLRKKLPGVTIRTIRGCGLRYEFPSGEEPVLAWRTMSRPTLQESVGVPTPRDRWQRYDG